jgi:hypothetical protein
MKPRLNINESFICRIWEGGNSYFSNLFTIEGIAVHVIDFGMRNNDGGPDYKDAKIRIGEKVFTGDVEVHRDFSGWAEHKHPKDSKYNSVILQVVLWDSKERTAPKPRKKRDIPTVILSKFLNRSIHSIWREIINDPSEKFTLPCKDKNNELSDTDLYKWLNKLSVERLNLKSRRIKDRLTELGKEITGSGKPKDFLKKSSLWEQAFYEYVFEALGFSKNKEPMLKLASSIRLEKLKSLISKINNQQDLIQSLLYGCSGLFFDVRIKDSYVEEIKSLWETYKPQFKVKMINKSEWQFFRLRPQNFPTLRIAYGSQLILKILKENLFKNIILEFKKDNFEIKDCHKSSIRLFEAETDKYWSDHYDFGKKSKTLNKLIGEQRINDVIINVILPLVYLYSVIFEKNTVKANVLLFYNLYKMKPDNSIINVIEKQVLSSSKFKINTPALEQAAIQLYNFYCVRDRCKECKVGERMLKNKGYEYRIIFY